MVTLVRRTVRLLLRSGKQVALDTLLRHGGRSVIESALETAADVVPRGEQSFVQFFPVNAPLTVYVRASHCHLTVRRHELSRVELSANLARAFGVELATDQDEAGIYIVARRKPVVGAIARLDLTLTLPSGVHLAFHLTPGAVTFADLNGVAEFAMEQVFTPAGENPTLPDMAHSSD